MELSEAIRQGSKRHPQHFGDTFFFRCKNGVVKSSVWGAILVALGEEAGHSVERIIERFLTTSDSLPDLTDFPEINPKVLFGKYPITKRDFICYREGCPERGEEHQVFYSFFQFLFHLSIKHQLTREQIADIVECIEQHNPLQTNKHLCTEFIARF